MSSGSSATHILYGSVTTSSETIDTAVTFGLTLPGTPKVIITPRDSIGGIAYYVSSVSTTQFVIELGQAIAKKFD